jgi:glyoxylase-like metal-dependent hydrolase (beta-lactamase superfamily II)
MIRTTIISTGAILLAAAVLPTVAHSQVNYDTIQVRTQELGNGLYMLQGSGGNIGLAVGNDAVFVVDDQFAPLTPKILAAIAAITPKPVRFVVNTHWHFDHTGGNENLGKAGALIVAHDNVRKRMSAGQFIEAINRREEPAPAGALPVVTFATGVTFHINGDSVVVTHVPPAHTDGDAVVHFTRANVVHMGDLFVGGLPFVDLSSGGSVHGVIGAAEKVLAMTNATTKIIPGHGALADRARLQAYRDMVAALRDRVRTEIAAGKTLDQILALNLAAPYAREFPSGHERFLRTLHQELTRR